jgi:hypothetical protein
MINKVRMVVVYSLFHRRSVDVESIFIFLDPPCLDVSFSPLPRRWEYCSSFWNSGSMYQGIL